MTLRPIRRALLSVHDKTGLVELARSLGARRRAGLDRRHRPRAARGGPAVTEVSEVTGAPEMLDGRVKTLHPAIHGGILARRDDPGHMATLDEQAIPPIDLVVVNLYPFEADGRPRRRPRRLRGADRRRRPGDDPRRRQEPRARRGPDRSRRLCRPARARSQAGGTDEPCRRRLAAQRLRPHGRLRRRHRRLARGPGRRALPRPARRRRPARAARCATARTRTSRPPSTPPAPAVPGVATARQLQGKELSYNNLADADAALALAAELDRARPSRSSSTPTLAASPSARDLAEAYARALACDPISAFGGIVACNRADRRRRRRARSPSSSPRSWSHPAPTEAARAAFAAQAQPAPAPARRHARSAPPPAATLRTVAGGLLVQDRDAARPGRRPSCARWSRAAPERGRARRPPLRLDGRPSTSSRTRSCWPATAPRSASAPAR